MSVGPEGRYPPERRIPTGVAPFALISLAAATGAGLLFGAWFAIESNAGQAGFLEPSEYAVIGLFTIPIVTAIGATVPILAAIVAGLLSRRLRSLLARALLVALVVQAVTTFGLSTLNVAVGPAPWLTYAGFAAIPAVALAVSAVVPWRGGFASRRYEQRVTA